MSEPYMGEIKMVGFNFAPVGWALCAAQILPIAQNTALFSLLGTTYGGNGQATFGLPDLRGRTAIGAGQGPGLSDIVLGEVSGAEQVTLTSQQMPIHNHPLMLAGAATNPVTAPTATNNFLGASGGGPGSASIWSTALETPIPLTPQQNTTAGGSQPVGIRSPYLGVNFVIALTGIFPTRS